MSGYKINRNGRYQCNFCKHPSYKIYGAMIAHLNKNHELEFKLAQKDDEIERLKNRPAKVVEKVVYKEKPEPKYWYIKNGGGIYCSTCKIVQMGVGIPQGQTIENTPHNCGNRTLSLVLEVR